MWAFGLANGHPTARHDGKAQLVRKLVWQWKRSDMPAGKVITTTCENKLCLNPEHMEAVTMKTLTKRMGAKGGIMSDPIRSAKIAATWREKHAKLTVEQVRDIRTSNETGIAMAHKYGIAQCNIYAIRKHKLWRDYTGNPFQGLGARK